MMQAMLFKPFFVERMEKTVASTLHPLYVLDVTVSWSPVKSMHAMTPAM